jgi:glycosyltransferase involved in cell wall biosynthesis
LKIGVFILSGSLTGGVHKYAQQMLRSLQEHAPEDELVVLETARDVEMEAACGPKTPIVLLRSYRFLQGLRSILPRTARSVGASKSGLGFRGWMGRHVVGRAVRRHGIDLMIFPNPAAEAVECGAPFVMTIHDLQYRIHPEFPEVSADGEADRREAIYGGAAPRAAAVLTDSATSRDDVVRFYGADPARVHPLPTVPPPSLARSVPETERRRVRERYGLPAEYVFYPAQFWPHKNHLRLIEAVSRHAGLGLVLGGSENVPFSTAGEARRRAAELLPGRHHFLGYIPAEDMAPLYGASSMLVMPTFFGPTNIPVMEAFGLGVPVVTSEMPGVREQTGDAALLADPASVDQIASAIGRVRADAGLRASMIEKGRTRAADWTSEKFGRRLVEIIRGLRLPERSPRP